MSAITKLLFAAALSMWAMSASTVLYAADAPDISGSYQCTYPIPTGTRTETMVVKKHGDVFNVQVISTDSPLPYAYATAIFNKDTPNAFGLVYWGVKTPTSFGLELYTLKSDGSFDGVYLDPDKTKTNTETCKKSS